MTFDVTSSNQGQDYNFQTQNLESPPPTTTRNAPIIQTAPTDSTSRAVGNENGNNNSTNAAFPALPPTLSGTGPLNGVPTNSLEFAANALNLGLEAGDIFLAQINSMPEGPEKARFMDFLQKVTAAIIEMQNAMHEMQTATSAGARDRSKAELEKQLDKIKKMTEEQEAMEAKQAEKAGKEKTMDDLNKVGQIFAVIASIIAVVVFAPILIGTIPFGALVLALLIIGIVDTCSKLDAAFKGGPGATPPPTIMSKVVEGVSVAATGVAELINSIPGVEMDAHDVEVAKVATKIAMLALMGGIMLATNPAVFLMSGSQVFTDLLGQSNAIYDAAMLDIQDENRAQMIQMGVGLAVTVACMVAGIVTSIMCPANVGALFEKVTSTVSKVANAVANFVARVLEKAFRFMSNEAKAVADVARGIVKTLLDPLFWVAATEVGLSVSNAVVTWKHSELAADLAQMRARYETNIVTSDAVIEILRKMINKMLEVLDGIGKDLTNLKAILSKLVEDLSGQASDITG